VVARAGLFLGMKNKLRTWAKRRPSTNLERPVVEFELSGTSEDTWILNAQIEQEKLHRVQTLRYQTFS